MMRCADSVSSIMLRTSRTVVAVRIMARVTAGITRLGGPSAPLGGNQPSATPNTSTSIKATQKFRNDSPTSETNVLARPIFCGPSHR
jgi:hypothetical protein